MKQGHSINGIKINKPEYINVQKFTGPIIVSSALFSVDIIEEIKEMALNNRIIVLN